MDNGLSLVAAVFDGSNREVLILIVMDNGLSRILVHDMYIHRKS